MKKIKWENITAIILTYLYAQDFLTVKLEVYKNDVFFGIVNYIVVATIIYAYWYVVKEVRLGKVKLFTE